MRAHLIWKMYSFISIEAIPSNRHPPRLSLFTLITRPSKLHPKLQPIEVQAFAERKRARARMDS